MVLIENWLIKTIYSCLVAIRRSHGLSYNHILDLIGELRLKFWAEEQITINKEKWALSNFDFFFWKSVRFLECSISLKNHSKIPLKSPLWKRCSSFRSTAILGVPPPPPSAQKWEYPPTLTKKMRLYLVLSLKSPENHYKNQYFEFYCIFKLYICDSKLSFS